MFFLYILFNVIIGAWFAYRIFYMHQFLLWDWHDGKVEYLWTNDKALRNPRSF